MYLNEGTLLNNLRRRYKKDLIYVSTAMHECLAPPVSLVDVRREHSHRHQSVQRTSWSLQC